jgi:PKD repeat protein
MVFMLVFFSVFFGQSLFAQVCCPEFKLKDAREICPPEGACQGGTAPGLGGPAMVACKQTTHHYTVYPNLPGYSYTWYVTGGTPVIITGNPVNILWGTGGSGTIKVVISNLATGGSCIDSLRAGICLIEGPQANFTMSDDTVCLNTPVIFTNTSLGGSDYYWDFGDGTYSTQANPAPHSYATAGTYTVTLTAYNAGPKSPTGGDQRHPCGCVDTISRTIVVLNGAGPVITFDCCYGTVCPGDTTSLCTAAACSTYTWTVTGGTIVSGAGTNCIKVKWNAVYSGPTTVTLAVPGCISAPCPGSTTINVPVLYPNLPISGPNPICVGSTGSFFLPHLPGTYYLWTTTAAPGTYSFNDKDRNVSQASITFSVAGTYQVQCQYQNPLAGCNGVSVFTIDVLPVFSFTGDEIVCEGSTSTYTANGNATWAVTPAGATVPPGPGTSKSITWNSPGTYTITATNITPGIFCNLTATKVVEVKARPVLGLITGPVQVCPNKNYTYKITSNTQESFFVWSVSSGSGSVMTQMGADRDSAIIRLNAPGPWIVSVFQQIEISPGVFCQSLTQNLTVNPYAAPVITGPSTVCVDAITGYTASGAVPPGGIQWTISPSNRGTVLSGQGTGSVSIRWHGTPTTAVITASHCGGSGTQNVTIINPPAVGNITANGPFEYCLPNMPNNLILSITSGFTSYQWYLNNVLISGATGSSYAVPNGTFTGQGIYYFSVDVSNGSCTITKTTYVLIGDCSGGGGPPNPVNCSVDFTINPNPACQNQPVTFTALPTGPGFAFSWNFGDGATSFQSPTDHEYALPGVYTVTLTATLGSCVAVKVHTVTVNPSPVASIMASDTIFCPGGFVTLTANPGMTSYQWFLNGTAIPTANGVTHNAVRHGEYEVVVTNSFGCPARSNPIYIYMHGIPKAKITGDGSICAYPGGPAQVTLSAFYDPAYKYDWSSLPGGAAFTPNNNNASFQTLATLTLPPVLPANYNFIVRVTDTVTGCEAYDTLCVWFYETPVVSVPFYSGCEGTPVTLTPSPVDTTKYTYQWSHGQTTPSVTVVAAGSYSVTMTDKSTGCSGMANAALIYPIPDLSLFPTGCKTISCKTDTLSMYIPLPLNALPPFNNYPAVYPVITWYSNGNWGSPIGTGQTVPLVFNGAGTHQISVVVQNQYGCADTAGVFCLTVACDTLDFGDAPDNPGAGFNYPTLLANNGARHAVSPNIFLGLLIDIDGNGQPNIVSSGDDIANLDDEDGITMPSVLMMGSSVSITVQASANGFLDLWIDYTVDGDWADPGEHVFITQPVVLGPNILSFTVPAAAGMGPSFARYRYRTANAPVSFNGLVADGEVEDYPVFIEECVQGEDLDFGDVPDNPPVGYNYPTLLLSNGARHMIYTNIRLGALIDAEMNGQPNIPATGDDLATSDDEDGVAIVGKMYVGKPANVQVTASINGFLNAWMDFNQDGDWADPGEQIFSNQPLTSGLNNLTFTIPATALQGKTYTRYRFNTTGGIPYFGLATDGEVEDYRVHTCPYWWPIETPLKHTIFIPGTMENLTAGDVLGVFYTLEGGILACGGLTEWTGGNQVMFAYGDDPITPVKDGFAIGEPIIWKLCSYIKGDADPIDVVYDPSFPNSNGVFVVNGLSALTSITGIHVTASAQPTLVCPDEPVQLGAVVTEGTDGVTFEWTSDPAGFVSGDQNPVANPAVSTTYFIHVFDGVFHANDAVQVTVTEVSPLVEVLPLQEVTIPSGEYKCYNATIQIATAGSGTSFHVLNGGNVSLIAGQSILLLPGTKVDNGGSLRAVITTTGAYCCDNPPDAPVIPLGNTTGFNEFAAGHPFFRVYPNPTEGVFTLELDGPDSRSAVIIEIYDMLGVVIFRDEMSGFRTHTFDLTGKKTGIYMVRVTSGDQTGISKVIRQ